MRVQRKKESLYYSWSRFITGKNFARSQGDRVYLEERERMSKVEGGRKGAYTVGFQRWSCS